MDDVSDLSDDGSVRGHRLADLNQNGRSLEGPSPISSPKTPASITSRSIPISRANTSAGGPHIRSVPGWPHGPRPVKGYGGWRVFSLILDMLVSLLPVIFIFIGCSAISLNGKERSDFGDNIIEASKYGTTAFPIVFAAVAARFLRVVALWRCERGAELGFLEQLVGSQSLASTVEKFFSLRRYNIAGVTIILFWALSPFGSQMTLRLIETRDSLRWFGGPIEYLNTTTFGGINDVGSSFESASGFQSDEAALSALVSASMLSSVDVLESSVDQWNNLKIPQISNLDQNWQELDNETYRWASLSGIVVPGLGTEANSSFYIETSYMQVSCDDSIRVPTDNLKDNLKSHGINLTLNNASAPWVSASSDTWRTLFLDTMATKDDFKPPYKPISLVYGSIIGNTDGTAVSGVGNLDVYKCSITNPRIDAEIDCYGQLCRVASIRLSPLEHESPKRPPFGMVAFENLLNFIPISAGSPHPGYASPIDQYMLGSDAPLSLGSKTFSTGGYMNYRGSGFGQRLTTLMNTVWQASLCPYGIGLGPNAHNISVCQLNDAESHRANTSISERQSYPDAEYATNKWHAGVLLAITLLLQLLAFATLAMVGLTKAPDVLGYVSSMTRDNPYMLNRGSVPQGGSWMDGAERARRLGKVRIKLGDVNAWRGEEAPGHVALVGVDAVGKGVENGSLYSGRLYD